MNVLILSDFSEVGINATHYAMDLLQDERVDFTLANIFVPDPNESPEDLEKRRSKTQSRLQERVEKLREHSVGRLHHVKGFYSEDKLVTAARKYVEGNNVELIVMGAVGKDFRHSTILGNHTYEIISKIKCNILAVPEECKFHGLNRMLMPIDYSVPFKHKNIGFLNENQIFHKTKLSVWDVASKIGIEQEAAQKEIFYHLEQIKVKFSNLDGSVIFDRNRWEDVQKKFNMIVILARNLRICDKLLSDKHGLYNSVPNRLPILVLHD